MNESSKNIDIGSALPGRAIYAFCRETKSELFRNITKIYQDFENSFSGAILEPSAKFAQWAGDVHKFGVHITIRGVCPVREEKIDEWFNIIHDVAGRFDPFILKGSRLSPGFPCRVIVMFDGPAQEKSRLNDFSASLARAVSPLIKLRQLSIPEIEEMRSKINSTTLIEPKKTEQLKILDEITTGVINGNLPSLPDRPEYRLPLLVSLWRDPAAREALFEVGEPFAIYLVPHISILAAVSSPGKTGNIIKQMENRFPHLIGQYIQLDRVYAVKENMDSLVSVNERDPRTGRLQEVQKPRWEIEATFPIGKINQEEV